MNIELVFNPENLANPALIQTEGAKEAPYDRYSYSKIHLCGYSFDDR